MDRMTHRTPGDGLGPTDQFQQFWAALNVRYFRGALPPIEIVWSLRLTASTGMFISRLGPRARAIHHADPAPRRRLIRLSAPLLRHQTERELVGTLAHEMIHQWQYDLLQRRPDHGAEFHRKMAAMNRDGLGITVHHHLEHAVRALAKYAWQCLQCGRVYERQRRTIRPVRHRCGACRGRLREQSSRTGHAPDASAGCSQRNTP